MLQSCNTPVWHYTASTGPLYRGLDTADDCFLLAEQTPHIQVSALFATHPFQPMHASAALGHLAKLNAMAMAPADAKRMAASDVVPRLAGGLEIGLGLVCVCACSHGPVHCLYC